MIQNPLVLALDFSNLDDAKRYIIKLKHLLGFIKVGLELFVSSGPNAIEELSEFGIPIFLDLKLHDIPHTVAKTISVIVKNHKHVKMLTVHTAGGRQMLQSAVEASMGKIEIIGVTTLTSLDCDDLGCNVTDFTLKMASLSSKCGLSGLVCSGYELQSIRMAGIKLKTVVPGIRFQPDVDDDQKRVLSPEKALKLGANYLVLGRTIANSKNPVSALESILTAAKQLKNDTIS